MGRRKKRDNPPDALDIVSYWANFKPYCMEFDNGLSWVPMTDIGEPSCQCCGCWNSTWDIGEFKRYKDDDSEEIKKEKDKYNDHLINERWEMCALEKAHIIPHRLGGPNHPSNFLMLCQFCHYEFDRAVEISSKDEIEKVFRFMASFPRTKREITDIIWKDIADDFKIPEEKLSRVCYLKMCIKRELFHSLFDDDQLEKLILFEDEMNDVYGKYTKDFRKVTKKEVHILRKIIEISSDDQLKMHLSESELLDFCIEFNKQEEELCLG